MTKKKLTTIIVSLILVITLALPNIGFVAELKDIEGHEFQEAIERMNSLGILIGDEHGDFNPDDTLLRVQAAKVAAMLSGKIESDADDTAIAIGDEKIFKDIYSEMPAHIWALGWIKLASDAVFIIGDETGNFNPGGTLTMQEWVTILIRVLGYEEPGMDWPSEYNDLAIDLGLTEGVTFEGPALITRAEMAQLALNALDKVKNSDGKLLSEIFFVEDFINEVVVFEDAEFERVIRQALGIESDSIYTSDLRQITSLYIMGNIASRQEIHPDAYGGDEPYLFSTLEDISKLVNLATLHINFKEIDDLTAIGKLKNLEVLNLSRNRISDLSPLAALNNLTSLKLSSNNITSILPLKQLTSLETLEILGNQVKSIAPVSSLTNLKSLDLSWNKISDITALSNLTKLEELNILANEISCIMVIEELVHLESLVLMQNQISAISALGNLQKLKTLDLSFNQLSDITALRDLNALASLSLTSNQIVDVEPLSKLTGLDTIFLSNNPVADRNQLRFLINTSIWW